MYTRELKKSEKYEPDIATVMAGRRWRHRDRKVSPQHGAGTSMRTNKSERDDQGPQRREQVTRTIHKLSNHLGSLLKREISTILYFLSPQLVRENFLASDCRASEGRKATVKVSYIQGVVQYAASEQKECSEDEDD